MNKDLLGGLVLLALSAGYFWSTETIPNSMLDDAFGPRGLPVILAGLLAFLSLVLISRALLEMRGTAVAAKAPNTAEGEDGEHASSIPRAFGFLAIGAAYLMLLPVVGYPIAITGMIAAVALYEGAARNWKILATAAFGGLLFWLLFDKLLGVAQPSGILF